MKLGEIDGVKFLARKSGGVKFWTNSMSGNVPSGHHDHYHSSHISVSFRFANINQKTKRTKGKTNTKITSSHQKLIKIQRQNLN